MPQAWLVGFLLLVLVGCTSKNPQTGSAVRIRWVSDPETLDPLALPNQQAYDAANLLHVSLLQFDFQAGICSPALATALPERRLVGDSLTRLDYHLRPEATWDNGQPVLATDVVFTIKLIHCPGLLNETARAQISFIIDCQPDPADPRHLVLLCRGQSAEYPRISGDFPVLPEATFDAGHILRPYSLAALRAGRLPTGPVAALSRRYQQADVAHHPERLPGCGPYRLLNWQPNRALVFQRKATWWADRLRPTPFVLQARPRQLQFIIIPDAAAAMLALRRHELDVFPQVPAHLFAALRTSDVKKELAFYTTPSNDVLVMGFNTERPALRNKYTRQALSLLLNPAALLAATQQGQGVLTANLLPPTSLYYNDSLAPLAYAPVRAAGLLRQAGWQRQRDGSWRQAGLTEPLGLVLHYRTGDDMFATVGLQLRAAAAQLGIAVELRPSESTVFTQALHAGDFDAYVRVIKGNPFVYNFAPLLHSAAIGEGNFVRLADPAIDHLLDAIVLASQPAQRRALLRQLQVQLRDQAALVPLFVLPYRLAADRRLRHVTPSSLKPGYAAAAMSWEPDTPTPAAATR